MNASIVYNNHIGEHDFGEGHPLTSNRLHLMMVHWIWQSTFMDQQSKSNQITKHNIANQQRLSIFKQDRLIPYDSKEITICVITLHVKKGLTDRPRLIGEWIEGVWKALSAKHPVIDGSRLSWDTLICICPESLNSNELYRSIQQICAQWDDEYRQGVYLMRSMEVVPAICNEIVYDLVNEISFKSSVGGQELFEWKTSCLEEANHSWECGDALIAGRILYEHVKVHNRPKWAVAILKYASQFTPKAPTIDELIKLGDDENRWIDAHAQFYKIRDQGSSLCHIVMGSLLQKIIRIWNKKERLRDPYLYLAENVAKVIYNSSDPALRVRNNRPGVFDYDAGWWVVHCLKSIVDGCEGERIRNGAWDTLLQYVESTRERSWEVFE